MAAEIILASRVGLIEAPAGCGKTQLITDILSKPEEKPYLVLTHTTAGVAALKSRLRSVPSTSYRVSTIAGWALTVANMFPGISGYSVPDDSPPDYNQLQSAVAHLLGRGELKELLIASYSRILVDEYQDCSFSQHQIVCGLAQWLPTTVFGDPMQAIFDFAEPLPNWRDVVQATFPIIAELDIPWRWNNAGSPVLGQWILNVRESLIHGNQIDLLSCPGHVVWYQLGADGRVNVQNQISEQYRLRQNIPQGERLLVIGDSRRPASRHDFARNSNGLNVVEPVDLNDVVSAAKSLDRLAGIELLGSALSAASSMMTKVNRNALLSRVNSIIARRNRNAPSYLEHLAVLVVQEGSRSNLLNLFEFLPKNDGAKVYRMDAYKALLESLKLSVSDPAKTISESAAIIREQRRHRGDKRIPTRAIGSTLLLKGLEAEHVLILNADTMTRQHLYVALSRGSKSVTVFSSSRYLR